ncbi:MAG: Uma2 family endonuclease [Myxococcota bacterium]
MLPKVGPRTLADWLAQPEGHRLELVDGNFIEKASPSSEHGVTQTRVGIQIGGPFMRRPGGRLPGGWWIASEVDIVLGADLFRPDLIGWRRERVHEVPRTRPTSVRPDWICEIVSETNAAHDRVVKMRAYHQAGVPHYWLLDPLERTLVVMRHAEGGYLNVLAATANERVRPEPFEAVEFRVASFFDDDDEA